MAGYVSDETLAGAEDLHTKGKIRRIYDDFAAAMPKPEPVQQQAPDIGASFDALLKPFRDAVDQEKQQAQQAMGQTGDAFGGMLESFKQQLGGGGIAPTAMPTGGSGMTGDKASVIRAAAAQYGVNPDIFDRQLNQEGAYADDVWNGGRNSSAGARGPGQFMTPTGNSVADQMGIPRDQFWASPELQVQGAAFHMAQLLKANGGDYARALAAYNAGQGAVNQYGGVPPYDETQTYVRNILNGQNPSAGIRDIPNATPSMGTIRDIPNERSDTPDPGFTNLGSAAMLADNAPMPNGPADSTQQSNVSGTIKGMPVADALKLGGQFQLGGPDDGSGATSGIGFDDPANALSQDGISSGPAMDQNGSGENAAANGNPAGSQDGYYPSSTSGGQAVSGNNGPARDDWRTNAGITPQPAPTWQDTAEQPDWSASPPSGAQADPGAGAPPPAPVEQPVSHIDRIKNAVGDFFASLVPGNGSDSGSNTAPDMSAPTRFDRQGQSARENAQNPETVPTPGEALSGTWDAMNRFGNAVEPFTATGIARETLGREQQTKEHQAEERRLDALLTQLDEAERTGDTEGAAALRQQIQPLMDTLNAVYKEAPRVAAERNPQTEGATTAINIGQGIVAGAIAPSIGAGLARNLAGAAIDPSGQALGAGIEAAGRGASEVARRMPRGTVPEMASGVVSGADNAPQYDRYYHGTADSFAKPDGGTFDPNGLFGPGYYITDDARVAGSYATERAGDRSVNTAAGVMIPTRDAARELVTTADELRVAGKAAEADILSREAERIANLPGDVSLPDLNRTLDQVRPKSWQSDNPINDVMGNTLKRIDEQFGQNVGQNIRPIDVPRGLNLLDADGPVTDDVVRSILHTLPQDKWHDFSVEIQHARQFDTNNRPLPTVWGTIYDAYGDSAALNKLLADMGYDGVRYQGGKRIPMTDAAGNAIEHNAIAIFPESLDKIRNATAGTPGGFVPRTPPSRGSGAAVDEAMVKLGVNAAQGGVAGAVGEAQNDPNATPQTIGKAALMGATQRVLLGNARGVLGPGGARNIANAIPKVGELYKDPVAPSQPSRTIPEKIEDVRRMFVRAWTDRGVDLGQQQKAAAREIMANTGNDLTAAEMAYESASRNASMAATQRINESLKPVMQTMGEDHPLLSEALTYLNNMDVATALGNPNRQFSEGLTAAESQQRLRDLFTMMTPDQRQKVIDGVKGTRDFVQGIRDDMLKAGVWSQELYDDLTQKYPNWTPTRIVEYMKDDQAQRGMANGQSVSMRDRKLRQYTMEGTEASREPPLMSLVRYAHEAESVIKRNETFNAYVSLADAAPNSMPLRSVPADYTTKRGEAIVTGFRNGVKETYVASEPVAASIKMASDGALPWYLTKLPSLFRESITSTPAFVAGQIPLDSFTALVRTSAREGGPQAIPQVAGNIVKGYVDAFKGILSGEYKDPDLARYMKEGAGMFGYQDLSWKGVQQEVDNLTRRQFMEIHGVEGINRLINQELAGTAIGGATGAMLPAEDNQQRLENASRGALAGAGIVTSYKFTPAIGHRVELGPRLAAGRMAEARALRNGADPATATLKAVGDFRDVTLDFQKGGTWAKVMNQVVPFFNVGWQSAATVSRAFRENPKAFPMTAAALIGTPTIAAEAWNNSDPQRAQDYADVPNYVKDRGIVIMSPGEAPVDKDGNRKPNYVLIPMRELAPVALMTRELFRDGMKMAGLDTPDPRGWGSVLGTASGAMSPIQANNPADLVSSVLPPVAGTAMQLGLDRDFFRGRDIATDRNDEQATAISKAIAEKLGVRPSQVEFAIRDVLGNQGAMALGAGDIAAGKKPESSSIQDQPIVGGVARRFVGSAAGQQLQDAKDRMVTPEISAILKQAGMRDEEVTAVPAKYQGNPIRRSEQAAWQRLVNVYLRDEIQNARDKAGWDEPSQREKLIREAVSKAKSSAAKDAFDASEVKDRALSKSGR